MSLCTDGFSNHSLESKFGKEMSERIERLLASEEVKGHVLHPFSNRSKPRPSQPAVGTCARMKDKDDEFRCVVDGSRSISGPNMKVRRRSIFISCDRCSFQMWNRKLQLRYTMWALINKLCGGPRFGPVGACVTTVPSPSLSANRFRPCLTFTVWLLASFPVHWITSPITFHGRWRVLRGSLNCIIHSRRHIQELADLPNVEDFRKS